MYDNAAAWLERVRKQSLSKRVLYIRGADSVELAAMPGRSDHELISSDGTMQIAQSDDFLVAAADLVLSGRPILPERGDRIHQTVGDATWIHEVLGPSGGPVYALVNAGLTVRIHTKRIDADEALK
jgi:hypothetical protein